MRTSRFLSLPPASSKSTRPNAVDRVLEERLQYPITLQIGSASIGNWTQTRTPYILPPIRSLNGRIDEFVILRRVLSHDEVKRMYELGKPNS